jgi:NADPH-dependent ferric siderophore reductase
MNQQPAVERQSRPAPVRRSVQVKRIEDIAPRIRRVTFAGPEMAGFETNGPAEHMKVFFPRPGEERPVVPEFGAQVEGPRPISRTYTPRFWRPETEELVVDFVMHGEGPASDWARSAEPGRYATVSTPKGAYKIEASDHRFLIAGDEAALPAIGTILESLPRSARADVYVEVDDPEDEQNLDSQAETNINWLHRKGSAPGSLLDRTIRGLPLSTESGRMFIACEASVMRDLRKHLLLDRELDRDQIFTHGYWKIGESNHPDHDRGQEI